MGMTEKQRIQRKLFAACSRAWAALPVECPDPPHCGGQSTRESVQDSHDDAGVMSSSYDFFMRCCLQMGDAQGNLVGSINDCYPCEPEYDELIPDPANPELLSPGQTVSLYVLGGVPPFTWTLISGDCVSMVPLSGRFSVFSVDDPACCGFEALVEDSCESSCIVGGRVLGGVWIEQPISPCVITGQSTDLNTRQYGMRKVFERMSVDEWGSIYSACQYNCPPWWDSWVASHCASANCLNEVDCDLEVGCDVEFACIWENRRSGICTEVELTSEEFSPDDDCFDGIHAVCRCHGYTNCIQQRHNYLWGCPE